MKKDLDFYLGYLRNPKEKITNGFQDMKETEVILYKDNNDYREFISGEKVLIVDKHQVFDGHQFTLSQAGFIGRVGSQIDENEALNRIYNIKKNMITEYAETLYNFMEDTRKLAEIGEQEYLAEVTKFENTFRKK